MVINKIFYRVPTNEVKQYKNLVKRAENRVQKNLAELKRTHTTKQTAVNAFVGMYSRKKNWYNDKSIFTQKTIFESKEDYLDYIEELAKWGGETALGKKNPMSYENIRKAQEKRIIKTYTGIAIKMGIRLEGGKLPQTMLDTIQKMSDDQIFNFYGLSDPQEDYEIEKLKYDNIEYASDVENLEKSFQRRTSEIQHFIPTIEPTPRPKRKTKKKSASKPLKASALRKRKKRPKKRKKNK